MSNYLVCQYGGLDEAVKNTDLTLEERCDALNGMYQLSWFDFDGSVMEFEKDMEEIING